MDSSGPRALGLAIPIVQAPIGGSSCPELAAAVSEAGGLGGLALTWSDSETVLQKIATSRSLTERPFYGNFALAFAPDGLRTALEAGLPIVTFSFGDPSPWIPVVRDAGVRLGIQVGNADEARRMAELEPDFLICQGIEAGGHLQTLRSLKEALPEVLAVARGIPVFAAGGLGDGRDLRRVLDQGAAGGVFGTRFLATRESLAHDLYKDQLLDAEASDPTVTGCFDGGWPNAPHRVLRNATLARWEEAGRPTKDRPGEGETVAMYADGEPVPRYAMNHPTRDMTGDVLETCLYAGTSVGKVRDVPPAGDLVRRLWAEAQGRREPDR